MDVKGLAQKYYPRLWDIDRLKAWWRPANCLRQITRRLPARIILGNNEW